MRYRNIFGVQGSYLANNPRHRRGRRRNPGFNLQKWLKPDHLVDGALIGAGFVISENLATQVQWAYTAPAPPAPPDIMKLAQDFVAHAGVGILGDVALDAMGQSQAGEKFAAGAIASGVVKLIANLHVLPAGILSPGSQLIAHRAVPGAVAAQATPASVRAAVYIPPVYGL